MQPTIKVRRCFLGEDVLLWSKIEVRSGRDHISYISSSSVQKQRISTRPVGTDSNFIPARRGSFSPGTCLNSYTFSFAFYYYYFFVTSQFTIAIDSH